ncbi:MAG: hypothetical protein ACE5JB_15825 [bacterium]
MKVKLPEIEIIYVDKKRERMGKKAGRWRPTTYNADVNMIREQHERKFELEEQQLTHWHTEVEQDLKLNKTRLEEADKEVERYSNDSRTGEPIELEKDKAQLRSYRFYIFFILMFEMAVTTGMVQLVFGVPLWMALVFAAAVPVTVAFAVKGAMIQVDPSWQERSKTLRTSYSVLFIFAAIILATALCSLALVRADVVLTSLKEVPALAVKLVVIGISLGLAIVLGLLHFTFSRLKLRIKPLEKALTKQNWLREQKNDLTTQKEQIEERLKNLQEDSQSAVELAHESYKRGFAKGWARRQRWLRFWDIVIFWRKPRAVEGEFQPPQTNKGPSASQIVGMIFLISLCGFNWGCRETWESVAEGLGIISRVKHHIDICVDVTAADELDLELAKDSVFVAEAIKRLSTGDHLHLYLIHAKAETRQEAILKAEMPAQPGPMKSDLEKARNTAIENFRKNWSQAIEETRKRRYELQTDLVGLFRYLSQHTITKKAKQTSIVILSDMQDVRSGEWNFERKFPDENLADRWKDRGFIVDLKGRDIFIFRCGPAHGISNEHYDGIRKFWRTYFQKTRANLIAYGYERDLARLLPEEEKPFAF